MAWWQSHHFENKSQNLLLRARILRDIRRYFDDQDFVAVETPALQIMPSPDVHIQAFETDHLGIDLKPRARLGLHTSPEIAMKKLIVAGQNLGLERIYQICPVFRNGEDSNLHSGEFTMLEWYRTGVDYKVLMDDCVDMVRGICQTANIKTLNHKAITCDPFKEWQKITVCEAFQAYANITLANHLNDRDSFAAVIKQQGIRIAEDGKDTWDDLFFRVMAGRIEPRLTEQGVPSILYDYPVCMASLARRKPDAVRFAERFELYICGLEVANAFSELTDADEQRKRLSDDMAEKERLYGGLTAIDEDFLSALDHGMPETAGIALGIDRLIMVMTGADTIDDVLWCQKI
jgi:lysyl-tRNA synthetase class 2